MQRNEEKSSKRAKTKDTSNEAITRLAFVTTKNVSGTEYVAKWFLLPNEAPPIMKDEASTKFLQEIHSTLSKDGEWKIMTTYFADIEDFSPEDEDEWTTDEKGRQVLIFHKEHPIFTKDETGKEEHSDDVVFPLATWGAKMLREPDFLNPNTKFIHINNTSLDE